MARITVEDCLDNESNRFSLVRLAARRAKQLLSGSQPVTDTKGNRAIVSALREIADGKVRFRQEESLPESYSDPLLDDLELAEISAAARRPEPEFERTETDAEAQQ